MIPNNCQPHNIVGTASHPSSGEQALCRIPDSLRLTLNKKAQLKALCSAGCEIRFRLNSPTATFTLKTCDVLATHFGGGLAQVLFGNFSQTYFKVGLDSVSYTLNAPDYKLMEQASSDGLFHPRLVRLLLPTHSVISELKVEGDISLPEETDIPKFRVLNYGSSITQGTGSLTSNESWAGLCAHFLRADLINLGFGGGCHCEPEMADYLVDRKDWDIAILETGINMLALDRGETNERIEKLIRKVAKAHQDKPIFCLGVFPCKEDLVNNFQGRAQEIRNLVKDTVLDIGSKKVHFIDGKLAMNSAMGLTSDLVHPSPAGMIAIANYVSTEIKSILRSGGFTDRKFSVPTSE